MRALCGKYQVTARLVEYSSLFTLQPSAFSPQPSLCRQAASPHARCSAHCGQCRCQDGYHHLNHCLPSLFLHTLFLFKSFHISHLSSLISHLKELPTWGKLFTSSHPTLHRRCRLHHSRDSWDSCSYRHHFRFGSRFPDLPLLPTSRSRASPPCRCGRYR